MVLPVGSPIMVSMRGGEGAGGSGNGSLMKVQRTKYCYTAKSYNL